MTAGIKRYKLIIKKRKKAMISLPKSKLNGRALTKSKLNSREVLISKALFDLNITHDVLVLINNVPKEIDDMKEKIKNSDDK